MRELKKSIPDDVRNNCWWVRPMKFYPYQMMYEKTVDGWKRWRSPYRMTYKRETPVDGWYQWSITHTRWCTNQLLMNDTDDGIDITWSTNQLLMDETNEEQLIPDEVTNNCCWMGDEEIHTRRCKNNCWSMRQMKKSIADNVGKYCWRMRPTKDYPYQLTYKTTVNEWGRWANPYQKMDETTVDGWDQGRTTHTRLWTK